MIVKMLGAILISIGSSIFLKNACVLKPSCLASLKCSVGIIDHPEISNRTANDKFMSIWPVNIPINPYIEIFSNPKKITNWFIIPLTPKTFITAKMTTNIGRTKSMPITDII